MLPQAYRDLVEVAGDAGRPVGATQIAAAAGLSTDKAKVETPQSKLSRLAEQGWLAGEAGRGCSRCRCGPATARGKRQNRSSVGLFLLGSKVRAKTNRSGRRAPWNRMP